MIKVYLWSPKGSNVGHLSLQLRDGSYISFWPADYVTLKQKQRATRMLTYRDDVEAEGGHADKVLELPDDIVDQVKIKLWWSNYVDNNQYHLLVKNCALTVREALIVGGIYQSNYVMEGGANRFGPMITPTEIYEWCAECKRLYPQKQDESFAAQFVRGVGNYFK